MSSDGEADAYDPSDVHDENDGERVQCDICLKDMWKRNLPQHEQRCHSEDAPPPDKFCKHVSVASRAEPSGGDEVSPPPTCSLNPVGKAPSSAAPPAMSLCRRRRPSTADAIDRDVVDDAVLSILEHHHDYSKESMRALVDENFPEIPVHFRQDFINVATSAAR